MTRERAKELLPIIAAYTEGKTIQYMSPSLVDWMDMMEPSFTNDWKYRIKPTPKLRPFRRGEIKCGDVVKDREGREFLVVAVHVHGVWLQNSITTYEDLFGYYTMADGSPCGKEEEE